MLPNNNLTTPIYKLRKNLWVKREDFIPFSFGGNKARKAKFFFDEFDKGKFDSIVTYGSSSSNHCRIIANICASRNIPCYIVSPNGQKEDTYNLKLTRLFGASIIKTPLETVHNTIEDTIAKLQKQGKKPFFIPGGGHGNIGTNAYVKCYKEILEWEKSNNIHFDYIFLASGTGTTQAGLVCGKILANDKTKIIGISIARKNPYGKNIVIQSVNDYLNKKIKNLEDEVNFIDDYICSGYGLKNSDIDCVIHQAMVEYGLPLDPTYTGKAFYGMKDYIRKNNLENKKVLFIHTGGTPIFFDNL